MKSYFRYAEHFTDEGTQTVTEPGLPGDQRYRLHGVERALDTLEFLAEAGPDGVTLTELAERIKVSKSSAFALLQTLVARGFAADSGVRLTRKYRLGMVLAKLGDAAEIQSPLVSIAMPIMQSVTDATGLTTRLVVPDGPFAVVTARVDAPGTVRFASYLGKREYPHCTSAGKALLSALPPERARALAVEAGMPARTERTITDAGALLRELELSAARGYTIDDEEDAEGVFCVGAAIHDRSGLCVAAVSGTGLKLNRSTWRIDELGLAIREAADQITASLGGLPFATRPSGWTLPSSPSAPSVPLGSSTPPAPLITSASSTPADPEGAAYG
jgi:IclR family acetate operon transcriptional repressor